MMKTESEHPKSLIADIEEPAPAYRSTWRSVISLWLVTRVGLSLLVLFCSVNFPHSPLEKQVAVWPPSAPLGGWLARVFLEPWNRRDVEHFLKIAERGYRVEDGTLSFHPLYPLFGKLAGLLTGGNELLGLFIVSNVCAVLFLVNLERLARFDLTRRKAESAPFYFLMMPTAFILFAPYTESLFLLCSTICLIRAREGRWFAAGLAGGLAVLTRQQGIFLLLPLAIEFWQWAGGTLRDARKHWIKALNLLLPPASMLVWLIYRAAALSDVSFNWRQPKSLIYGLLISPSATQLVAEQRFIPPWQALSIAVRAFSATNAVDLLAGSFYVLVLILGAKQLWRMRISYPLYAILVIIVSFSLSTGPQWSYMGLPRHCLLAFPLVFLLAEWGAGRSARLIISLLGTFWLIFLTMFYALHWVA